MCPEFQLNASQGELNAIEEIRDNSKVNINPSLYEIYSDNLKRAVNSVYSSAGGDVASKLKDNVDRFAAYKAYHATTAVKGTETNTEAIGLLNKFNRWQAAEYNATVARARSAKQWEKFMEHADVLPNIRWVPSRSVKVREEHTPFYNRIWAKTDPFWSRHQPGNCYGCKCDWVETFEQPTEGNPKGKPSASPGLEGNPAITGEVFTAAHNYFKKDQKYASKAILEMSGVRAEEYLKPRLMNVERSYNVGGTVLEFYNNRQTLEHIIDKGLRNREDLFWSKNLVLLNELEDMLKAAKPIGRAESSLGHNKGKKTLTLKRKTDYFYYYEVNIHGHQLFLHLGRYRESGKMYLYDITDKRPKVE